MRDACAAPFPHVLLTILRRAQKHLRTYDKKATARSLGRLAEMPRSGRREPAGAAPSRRAEDHGDGPPRSELTSAGFGDVQVVRPGGVQAVLLPAPRARTMKLPARWGQRMTGRRRRLVSHMVHLGGLVKASREKRVPQEILDVEEEMLAEMRDLRRATERERRLSLCCICGLLAVILAGGLFVWIYASRSRSLDEREAAWFDEVLGMDPSDMEGVRRRLPLGTAGRCLWDTDVWTGSNQRCRRVNDLCNAQSWQLRSCERSPVSAALLSSAATAKQVNFFGCVHETPCPHSPEGASAARRSRGWRDEPVVFPTKCMGAVTAVASQAREEPDNARRIRRCE